MFARNFTTCASIASLVATAKFVIASVVGLMSSLRPRAAMGCCYKPVLSVAPGSLAKLPHCKKRTIDCHRLSL